MSMEEELYRRRSYRIWALEEAAKLKQKEKEEKDKAAKEKQKEKLKAKQNASPSMPLPDSKRGRKEKRLEEVVVSAVSRVHFQLSYSFTITCYMGMHTNPTFFLFFLYPFQNPS